MLDIICAAAEFCISIISLNFCTSPKYARLILHKVLASAIMAEYFWFQTAAYPFQLSALGVLEQPVVAAG